MYLTRSPRFLATAPPVPRLHRKIVVGGWWEQAFVGRAVISVAENIWLIMAHGQADYAVRVTARWWWIFTGAQPWTCSGRTARRPPTSYHYLQAGLPRFTGDARIARRDAVTTAVQTVTDIERQYLQAIR